MVDAELVAECHDLGDDVREFSGAVRVRVGRSHEVQELFAPQRQLLFPLSDK
jgi:hypothetical protein